MSRHGSLAALMAYQDKVAARSQAAAATRQRHKAERAVVVRAEQARQAVAAKAERERRAAELDAAMAAVGMTVRGDSWLCRWVGGCGVVTGCATLRVLCVCYSVCLCVPQCV